MTSEHLLEAMGLLDDDLILQAERSPARKPVPWQRWLGLCACLALVFLVGRGMVENWSGGNSSGSAGASTSAGANGTGNGGFGPSSGVSGDRPAMIWVEGTLYISADQKLSDEVEESAILGETTYTDGTPDEEGETNFSRDSTLYARTADGIAVLVDGAWALFTAFEW